MSKRQSIIDNYRKLIIGSVQCNCIDGRTRNGSHKTATYSSAYAQPYGWKGNRTSLICGDSAREKNTIPDYYSQLHAVYTWLTFISYIDTYGNGVVCQYFSTVASQRCQWQIIDWNKCKNGNVDHALHPQTLCHTSNWEQKKCTNSYPGSLKRKKKQYNAAAQKKYAPPSIQPNAWQQTWSPEPQRAHKSIAHSTIDFDLISIFDFFFY